MAELDVQRKRSNPWWIWLLFAIVLAGLLFYFLKDRPDSSPTGYSGHTPAIVRLGGGKL